MSIYKDCDVRGVYGREITAPECRLIGRALATMAPGKLLLGGDLRLSTPELKGALTEGLLASGAALVDLGTIPTPVLYYALKHSDAVAGATVTASHNPPEYNGVKFMIGSEPVTRKVMDALHDIVLRGDFAQKQGTLTHWDATRDYLDSLDQRFTAPKPLHILMDAGNGAMSRVAPEAFRRAGYRVTELYCEPDGAFPNRSPNPADYSCLGPTGEAVLEMGGTPLPEKSGHAFIKKRFLDNGAAVAGEVSGHFFFGELGYDDGLFAGLSMAELVADIVCPPITPDLRMACPYAEQQSWLDRAEALARSLGAEISHLDGVRADFPDGWFLMRKSVTAEQITLRAEARSRERLQQLLDQVAAVLPESARDVLTL